MQETIENKVSIFGLGGAGCNIVKQIMQHNEDLQHKFNYLFCNEPEFSLSKEEYHTNADIFEITDFANYDFSTYSRNLTYVIAGLAGKTGANANNLAKLLHQRECIVVGIGVLPYKFENNIERATQTLYSFDSETNATIVLKNQEIMERYSNMPVGSSFKKVNNTIADIIAQNTSKEELLTRLQETIKKLNNPIFSILERE